MLEINTKIGLLYLEYLDEREEADRLKLYDSKERYLDYYPLSCWYNEAESYVKYGLIVDELLHCDTVHRLMDDLRINHYTTSRDWKDIYKTIYGKNALESEEEDILESAKKQVEANEYVNIVGDTYVFIDE